PTCYGHICCLKRQSRKHEKNENTKKRINFIFLFVFSFFRAFVILFCLDRLPHVEGRLLRRDAAEEGLGQQQDSAADQAAVGDVEHRPVEIAIVQVQEVAHAIEDDAIVDVAERAGQNQPKSGG